MDYHGKYNSPDTLLNIRSANMSHPPNDEIKFLPTTTLRSAIPLTNTTNDPEEARQQHLAARLTRLERRVSFIEGRVPINKLPKTQAWVQTENCDPMEDDVPPPFNRSPTKRINPTKLKLCRDIPFEPFSDPRSPKPNQRSADQDSYDRRCVCDT